METVFFWCIVAGLGVLVLQLLLHAIGIGLDFDLDFGWDHALAGVLNVHALTAGVLLFGVAGAFAMGLGLPPVFTYPLAAAPGLVGAAAVGYLIHRLRRTLRGGDEDVRAVLQQSASVVMPIPAGRTGHGRVRTPLRGVLREFSALTDGPGIPAGVEAVVIGVLEGNVLEVIPQRFSGGPAHVPSQLPRQEDWLD